MKNEEVEHDSSSERDSSEEAARKNNQTCINTTTLNAIAFKQQVDTKSKQMNQDILGQQEKAKNITMFCTLSERIKHIFSFGQHSTLFVSKLLEKMMSDNQRGSFMSKGK